jgi:hypothetical protein
LVPKLPSWLAVLGVAALLAAGCGDDDDDAGSPAKTQAEAASSGLEGVWRTGTITPEDVEATLRRNGLGRYVERFRRLSPIQRPTTLILDLHTPKTREWDLYGKAGSGPREEIDFDATYAVEGDEVVKTHATGETTYRWSVEGDTLTIEWLDTTEPDVEGVPDEVFGRALYMTQPFKRQP